MTKAQAQDIALAAECLLKQCMPLLHDPTAHVTQGELLVLRGLKRRMEAVANGRPLIGNVSHKVDG